ncbi:sigma-70 family RNA polymerase sigma factor [Paenibacillus sp. GCM10027627]|uniref:sigma-70 family RNA polymerase sigma factor n=1 Tax=unclassified Paenibacillus TaxID=185978 RepID=UPI00363C5EF5
MKDERLRGWAALMIKGDEEAFQLFFEETKSHAYSMIYYLIGHERDVDDIMSEVYIALLRSLGSYDQGRPIIPWFNGLIIRQVRSWRRGIWRSFRVLNRAKKVYGREKGGAVDAAIEAVGNREEVLPFVNRLSHKLREVIVLKYYQDCSLESIADVLNIPVGTVKSRHSLALKQLRSFMETSEREGVSTYVH